MKIYLTLAALCCVIIWALKPVLVKLVGSDAGFAEIYILSSSAAVIFSLIIFFAFWKNSKKLLKINFKKLLKPLGNASIAGLCLALWYYGFYRSLTLSSSSADATVIAFSWPLIAVVAMMIFSKKKSKRLTVLQWSLMILSFVGVALISLNNSGALGGSGNKEIFWAVAAAIGSGLYLPFSVNASRDIKELSETSSIYSTFISISFTNLVSLITVIVSLFIFQQHVDFSNLTGRSIFICLIIGLGIYVIAEISWTWIIQSSDSLTIASLPYFSPAISVILLFILFSEPVSIFTWAGLILILSSNFALQKT